MDNAVRFATWSKRDVNRSLSGKGLKGGEGGVARVATREFELPAAWRAHPEPLPLVRRRITCTRLSSCTYYRVFSSVMCTRRPALRYNVIQHEILFPLPLSFSLFAPLCVCAFVARIRFTLWGEADASLISNSIDRAIIHSRIYHKRCLLAACRSTGK